MPSKPREFKKPEQPVAYEAKPEPEQPKSPAPKRKMIEVIADGLFAEAKIGDRYPIATEGMGVIFIDIGSKATDLGNHIVGVSFSVEGILFKRIEI